MMGYEVKTGYCCLKIKEMTIYTVFTHKRILTPNHTYTEIWKSQVFFLFIRLKLLDE